MSSHALARRHTLLAFLAYLAFVVYGSLVPFDYRPHTLEQALDQFAAISYLKLGVGSRADWIANILLYMPLAFLGCAWGLGMRSRRFSRYWRVVVVWGGCLAVAVGVEFTQIFFAPRTVSLNDLYAETLGSSLGLVVFILGRHRLVRLWDSFVYGGRQSVMALAAVFGLGYLVLELFPYDFVISRSELAWKLENGNQGWWLADDCGSLLRCAVSQFAEMAAIAPWGVLMALARPGLSYRGLFVLGLGLGLGLELLQLLLASGTSQGLSLLWRAVGLVAGAALGKWLGLRGLEPVASVIRRAAPWLAVPYGLVLLGLNGWFSTSWLASGDALARLAEVHFLPFYYQYFTTETRAMASVLFQMGIYLPVGLLAWAWRGGIGAAAGWGVLLAFPVEFGKLWLPPTHPDPTNLGVVAASVAGVVLVMNWFERVLSGRALSSEVREPPPLRDDTPAFFPATATEPTDSPRWLWFAVALGSLWDYPLGWRVSLILGLAVVLWRWRWSGLIVLPAALPWLDFAVWSGRLYWNEFDSLLLFALALLPVTVWRVGSLRYPERLALLGFVVSALISLMVGLLPPDPIDVNAFSHYTTTYNALRAAKGWLFALALWPWLRAEWRADASYATDRLVLGMVLGVVGEVAYVLWERMIYVGLWNVETDYRITGTFAGMHVGGASIEAYLVLALPFVWLWAWRQRQGWVWMAAGVIYALGSYAVMVTFSRGGQAAFVVVTVLAVLGFARLGWRGWGWGWLPVMAAVAALVAWPVLGGKFSQSRLATLNADMAVRVAHWQDALAILDQAGNPVFGAGLGRFPAAFYWYSSAPARPATYGFGEEGGSRFLSLGAGESLYFEQVVAVEPEQEYVIALDARSSAPAAELVVPLCEKALLYAFTCDWHAIPLRGELGQWGHYQLRVNTHGFGPPGVLVRRPVKLSLFNQTQGTVVDVDNISLITATGDDLIRNGDFEDGMRYWFFSTDSHLAWHAKNLFVHVLFEQGGLGLVAFLGFVGMVLGGALRRSGRDPLALTLLLSLGAFLIVGTIDSLIDEPRLAFLFFLLLFVAAISGRVGDARHEPRRSFGAAHGRID